MTSEILQSKEMIWISKSGMNDITDLVKFTGNIIQKTLLGIPQYIHLVVLCLSSII